MLPHSGNHLNDLITSAVIGVLMALFFGKNKAGKSLDDSITSAIKRGFASLFGGRNKYPPEKNPDNPNMSANGAARFDNNSLYDELPKKNGLSNTTVFILYVIIIGGLAYVIISSYSDRQKETVVTLAPESQNQQDQGASQQRVEQIHEVVSPEEVARLEAQKQSERIKLMFNEKNYEALSSEYSTEKKFFLSDFYYFGVALYSTGKYAQALSAFLQAESQYPNDPTFITYLGNSYYTLGDQVNARKKYHEAENLLPNDSVIKSNLGDAYLSDGDADNALKKYREALVLDPQNSRAREGIKRIDADKHRLVKFKNEFDTAESELRKEWERQYLEAVERQQFEKGRLEQ